MSDVSVLGSVHLQANHTILITVGLRAGQSNRES